MGIDWNWIYQRPQILAQKLSQDYDVTVVFPRSILQERNRKRDSKNLDFKVFGSEDSKSKTSSFQLSYRVLKTIPFQEKIRFLGWVANLFHRRLFLDYQQYDFIYIGYPLYARYIPEDYKGCLIYDCMDNQEALYPDQKRVYRIVQQEEKLIRRCQLLFVSAQMLAEKVNQIAGYNKAVLIRNGVEIQKVCQIQKPVQKPQYRIAYIGTIAEWFDYALLRQSLKKKLPVVYELIGPIRSKDQEETTDIIYKGIIEHSKLKEIAAGYDALIMPFQCNDIVLSVDPVKLYEYISFGKCIISIYYKEIERFEEFVYFYRTQEEYQKLLETLCQKGFPPKYNAVQQQKFLEENSWKHRYKELKKILDNYKR